MNLFNSQIQYVRTWGVVAGASKLHLVWSASQTAQELDGMTNRRPRCTRGFAVAFAPLKTPCRPIILFFWQVPHFLAVICVLKNYWRHQSTGFFFYLLKQEFTQNSYKKRLSNLLSVLLSGCHFFWSHIQIKNRKLCSFVNFTYKIVTSVYVRLK